MSTDNDGITFMPKYISHTCRVQLEISQGFLKIPRTTATMKKTRYKEDKSCFCHTQII